MARKDKDATASGEKKQKKPGRIKQMVQVYKFTQEVDSSTLPMMLGSIALSIVVMVLLSWWLISNPWYGIFLGIAIGLLVAMLILARKAERAAFSRIAGQPGAPLAAMQSIRRGWDVHEEPVQIDRRTQKMIYRASGRAGIALVADDDSRASLTLLDKETKAIRRVLHHENVPIHHIIEGDEQGQVPLHKLPTHMQRMKKVLTRDESAEVGRRLNALQRSLRQAVPKGVDPMRMRPDRRAMRGR